MRVLTYNIAGHRGRGRKEHLERVAELIVKVEADLVGLQEVIHHHAYHEPPEVILASLTGMNACYLPAHAFKHKTLGNAVLCRGPLLQTVSHDLPHVFPERRILLEVETRIGDLPLTIFCTHLVHMARFAARMRLAQATAVAKEMAGCRRPHLLVGDLNASPNARELQPVREWTNHAGHHTGLRSWPARRPVFLYDHIWPGPGWEVERAEILDAHVSDHRPLFAQLGWRGTPKYEVPNQRSGGDDGKATE